MILALFVLALFLFPIKKVTSAQTALCGIVGVAWSPNGSMIAGVGTQGFLRVWDAETKDTLFTFPKQERTVFDVVWSPDSDKIASSGGDTTIRIWNIADPDYTPGELIASFEGHRDWPMSLAWSPDGTRLASASFDEEFTLKVWDVMDFQPAPITQQKTSSLYDVAWTPDSKYLAVGSAAGLLVFDATLNILPFAVPEDYRIGLGWEIFAVAWNPDGTQIAGSEKTGYDESAKNLIHIWDVGTKTEVWTLEGHTDYIQSLVWNSDGTLLASASEDQTVRVWDVASGQSIATFENPKDVGTTGIAWSPDGGYLAFGGSNDTLIIVSTAEFR